MKGKPLEKYRVRNTRSNSKHENSLFTSLINLISFRSETPTSSRLFSRMPPLPNTSTSGGTEGGEVSVSQLSDLHESAPDSPVNRIKNQLLAQNANALVTLKPYEDRPKDWEILAEHGYKITEKIEHYEKRIQSINEDNLHAIIQRRNTCKEQNKSISSEKLGCFDVEESDKELIHLEMSSNGINGHGLNNNGVHKPRSPFEDIDEDSNQNQNFMAKKISRLASWYLHFTAFVGIYLLFFNGQVLGGATILWALAMFFVLIGLHTLKTHSKVSENKWLQILMELMHPQLFFKNEMESKYEKKNLFGSPNKRRRISMGKLIWLVLPVALAALVPWLFWDEYLSNSYFIISQLVQCASYHVVNFIKR